jgi:hypothetical protein
MRMYLCEFRLTLLKFRRSIRSLNKLFMTNLSVEDITDLDLQQIIQLYLKLRLHDRKGWQSIRKKTKCCGLKDNLSSTTTPIP